MNERTGGGCGRSKVACVAGEPSPQLGRRCHEGHARQQGKGAGHCRLGPLTDRASVDVTGHSLAEQGAQAPVPAAEQTGQIVALLAPPAGNEERDQTAFDPLANATYEHIDVRRGHPERIRKVVALEPVTQLKIEHGAVAGFQPFSRLGNQPLQFGLPSARGEIVVDSELVEAVRWRGAIPHASKAFVAGNRVQPRSQFVGIAKLRDALGSQEQGVLHGVGRVMRGSQHRPAVVVESISVDGDDVTETRHTPLGEFCNELSIALHG